jgi:hypothetical protein
MHVTRKLEVSNAAGRVLCSLYVNDRASTEASIQAELQLQQVPGMSVTWDDKRKEWQVQPQASKRVRFEDEAKEEEEEEVKEEEEGLQVGSSACGSSKPAVKPHY